MALGQRQFALLVREYRVPGNQRSRAIVEFRMNGRFDPLIGDEQDQVVIDGIFHGQAVSRDQPDACDVEAIIDNPAARMELSGPAPTTEIHPGMIPDQTIIASTAAATTKMPGAGGILEYLNRPNLIETPSMH